VLMMESKYAQSIFVSARLLLTYLDRNIELIERYVRNTPTMNILFNFEKVSISKKESFIGSASTTVAGVRSTGWKFSFDCSGVINALFVLSAPDLPSISLRSHFYCSSNSLDVLGLFEFSGVTSHSQCPYS